MIDKIRILNSKIQIRDINSSDFSRYGKKVTGIDFTEFIEYLNTKTVVPENGNKYVASDPDVETLAMLHELEISLYGVMPLEAGWCNGNNTRLEALEYHKGSEINVAATPSVLFLGSIFDIRDNKIDTVGIMAFYIEQGEAVELYATTLHYSPCTVSASGFKMGIILPRGTNELIDLSNNKDPALWMRNKWLYVHTDAVNLIGKGAYVGITGKIPEITFD